MKYRDIIFYQQNASVNHNELHPSSKLIYTQPQHVATHRWVCIQSDEAQENMSLSWRSSATKSADGFLVMFCADIMRPEIKRTLPNNNNSLHILNMNAKRKLPVNLPRHYGLFIPKNLLGSLKLDANALSAYEGRQNLASEGLLKKHIFNLHENLGRVTTRQSQQLIAPTLVLIKALLKSTPSPQTRQETNTAIIQKQDPLTAVQHFIDNNLFNEDLSSDMIARATGHSRASLYRLCEPLGGIHRHIKSRRLTHALKCLTGENTPPSSITNLAFDLGFGSESTFRRAFKEAFGMTPKDARNFETHILSVK
jgi:AraC-like DNA-binding protein